MTDGTHEIELNDAAANPVDALVMCSYGVGKMKDANFKVEIIENVLTISVGTDILKHACEAGRAYGGGDIKITNEAQFLEGFVKQLSAEKEDGSTLIHHAFDRAIDEMLENGERGVDWSDGT